jgi:hypothetical protein
MVEIHGRACTQVIGVHKERAGIFHFLETVTGWLVPSAGQKILVQPGWYLPRHKIPLAENRFLEGGRELNKYKGKVQAVLSAKVKDCPTLANTEHRHFFQVFCWVGGAGSTWVYKWSTCTLYY